VAHSRGGSECEGVGFIFPYPSRLSVHEGRCDKDLVMCSLMSRVLDWYRTADYCGWFENIMREDRRLPC
jgi:hypothetical protein